MYASTSPWLAILSARFAEIASPCLRNISIARASSPPASSSAFLQSAMPTPVLSRNFFTSAAEIAISVFYLYLMRKIILFLFAFARFRACVLRAASSACARRLRFRFGFRSGLLLGGMRFVDLYAFGNGVRNRFGDDLYRADGIVVRGDREIDRVGIDIRIRNCEDRDAEYSRLVHGKVLFLHVNHEHRSRQARHVGNTAEY